MSYAMAAALQSALYDRLSTDPGVTALVGGAIYDALPTGALPETYVILGAEDARDRSTGTSSGAEHLTTVSVVTEMAGFSAAKAVAVAISDALEGANLTLGRGRLVGLWFLRARARRTGSAGRLRRIDLKFRARVEDI